MDAHSTAAKFEISHRCYIAADGKALAPLPSFADAPTLASLYRSMVLTRSFDARAVALQRSGQLGTYASSLGQEAVAVGIGSAMRPSDVLVPSFREHGTQLLRGVTASELLRYWGGDERGNAFANSREDLPICIPVGSQAPHAAGVALGIALRGEERAVVCVLGDGATSKGDFYEAINLAGVWELPVVFVVVNNQWAISVPVRRQTAAGTLAQKAIAAGIPGEQVDGNDVVAVRQVLEETLAQARSGAGPALVEALTYRLADHTTSDDASRYRDANEVEGRRADDPLERLRGYLSATSAWSDGAEEALRAECGAAIEQAVEEYLSTRAQPPESIFDFLHERLPDELVPQREALIRDARDDA